MSLIALQPIKAVLFDLDGTLVHSSLDFDQIRQDISCPDNTDVLSFLETLPADDRVKAEQTIVAHELRDAYRAKIMPGAKALLARLSESGFKTGIVTRNSAQATQIKVARCGLTIEKILTREDAPAKPDPSGLLEFSQAWGFIASECIYVGDYLYDIQAANNAKMHACLYLDQRQAVASPSYADKADFVCAHFDHFETDLGAYLASTN